MDRGGTTMFLGIEIGGTKLQIGLGRGDGTLIDLWRGGVDVARGGEGIRAQILQATPALLQRAGLDRTQVRGGGVGFGGPSTMPTRPSSSRTRSRAGMAFLWPGG